MSGYLIDSSALWHLFRTPTALQTWEEEITHGMFRICEATRIEFLYSARGPAHRDELAEDLDTMCEPSNVPKQAWRWVETAQYKLTQHGQHRSASAIDLLVCATAALQELTVLHVDHDFHTVSAVLPELHERNVTLVPEPNQ